MQALVPRDEADEHSAILEVRAGGCGGEATCDIQDTEDSHRNDHCTTNSHKPLPRQPLLLYTLVLSCTWTGAGGQEASLFAAEIFLMYQK